MKKVCVVIGSRANYSSIKSVLYKIVEHNSLELQLIVCASAVLGRYGDVASLIEADGFIVSDKLYFLIEGETPLTMAKSTGIGLLELSSSFDRLKPDIVLTIGDRFETMATTLAAAYMNIPLAHTMGGEVSGTIDESIRHAITKFAHIHFPANKDAADRIVRLGEDPSSVHIVGCPRIDYVNSILSNKPDDLSTIFEYGVGDVLDLSKEFIILSQHPVTTEYSNLEEQMQESLAAIVKCGCQAIILWPNSDAGSEKISHAIRRVRETKSAARMHFFKNLPVSIYVQLMARCACLVGNSSSGIREGAFIGTPVVNIGSRQFRRQRGNNVLDVNHNAGEIAEAIKKQLNSGRYPSESIYGDGHAAERIADILATTCPSIQKTIMY